MWRAASKHTTVDEPVEVLMSERRSWVSLHIGSSLASHVLIQPTMSLNEAHSSIQRPEYSTA